MSFAARLTRTPLAHDRDLGASGLEHLPGLAPELRALIAGTAGSSPYLARSIKSEAAWLTEALDSPPEEVLRGLIAETEATTAPGHKPRLRLLKRRVALLVALADLGGVWDLAQVTGALTQFAEAATRAALRAGLVDLLRRGRIPGMGEDDLADGAGMVVLAMGKMGAHELNYSSDIDLICLFDNARFDPGDEASARAGFVKATRAMTAALSEVTGDGYVFRTDLRLRPDPGSTPVCLSITAAERYYEAEGRNWERAAHIKARPVAGSIAAGAAYLQALRPFIWRKHLDFAAIHDTQVMRQRIRDHKGLHGLVLEGHNVKLGEGGIREIEFFAQTRQLIAGGRDAGLRVPGTVAALAALAQAGWMPQPDAEALSEQYTALREVEHRLQMIADAQTHSLPQSAEGFDRVARLSGEGDTAAYRAALLDRFRAVHALTEPFFDTLSGTGAGTGAGKATGGAEGAGPASAQTPDLSETARGIVERWLGYPALRSERGRALFARLRPELLGRLMATERPDEALANFDGFLRGLPAGVQLFSLFEANPALVDLIVDICGTAPGLSRYLSRNAGVLDAVLGGSFFTPWPGARALAAELGGQLSSLDYEAALDAARRWQKDWHFRIGVHVLRGLATPAEAAMQFADLAEACVVALWSIVQDEIARRHGPAPGLGASVLAMGSLGAGAMAAESDLDLLVIYDAGDAEMSEGPRPLEPRRWYARATKALVAALSAPMAEGTLYAVDMRLRPSGRQGPVATGIRAFESYQQSEAWTWEHLALTRARAVAGPRDLSRRIEAIRQSVLAAPRDPATVLQDTAAMRARLREAGRGGGDGIDVKTGPGGAQDIALLVQAGTLIAGAPIRSLRDQIDTARDAGVITQAQAGRLAAHADLYEAIRQGVALLAHQSAGAGELGQGGQAFLARLAGTRDWPALSEACALARDDARAIIDAILPEPAEPPKEPPTP